MLKKFNDIHIYYDNLQTSFSQLEKLNKNLGCNFVISPQCTTQSEPEKSSLMYSLQPYLLSNIFFFYVAKYISKSFYKKNKLRLFWKIFSNFKNYRKVINPDNDLILNKIKNYKFLKIWYWINPHLKYELNLLKKYLNNDKVFGLKFHNYWHNFRYNQMHYFLEINNNVKPVYLILNYNLNIENDLDDLLKKFKKTKFIIGYGGFPHYQRLWNVLNNYPNLFIDTSSNHLNEAIIKKMLNKVNIHKIIFGSDYPYNFKVNFKFSYDLFLKRILLNLSSKKSLTLLLKNNFKKLK
jgi:hypothetical protein